MARSFALATTLFSVLLLTAAGFLFAPVLGSNGHGHGHQPPPPTFPVSSADWTVKSFDEGSAALQVEFDVSTPATCDLLWVLSNDNRTHDDSQPQFDFYGPDAQMVGGSDDGGHTLGEGRVNVAGIDTDPVKHGAMDTVNAIVLLEANGVLWSGKQDFPLGVGHYTMATSGHHLLASSPGSVALGATLRLGAHCDHAVQITAAERDPSTLLLNTKSMHGETDVQLPFGAAAVHRGHILHTATGTTTTISVWHNAGDVGGVHFTGPSSGDAAWTLDLPGATTSWTWQGAAGTYSIDYSETGTALCELYMRIQSWHPMDAASIEAGAAIPF